MEQKAAGLATKSLPSPRPLSGHLSLQAQAHLTNWSSAKIRVLVSIDLKRAFLVLCARAMMWKERHHTAAIVSPSAYHHDPGQLLADILLPSKVAAMFSEEPSEGDGRECQRGTDWMSRQSKLLLAALSLRSQQRHA